MGKSLTLRHKNRAKLAFDLLEQEMEVLTSKQTNEFKGGQTTGFNDCVIEAISYATGLSYNQVLDAYGAFKETTTGVSGSSGAWEYNAISNGVNYTDACAFAVHMGLTNSGDVPQGANGTTQTGDQSVAYLDYGNGNGHAIVLTGNANNNDYSYYDPQNNVWGTISKNDPRFMQTFGY